MVPHLCFFFSLSKYVRAKPIFKGTCDSSVSKQSRVRLVPSPGNAPSYFLYLLVVLTDVHCELMKELNECN